VRGRGGEEGRVAVVTGANGGIGRATAAALVRVGYRVVLACRSREKAEAARREILAGSGGGAVEVMGLDLASMGSVRAFAGEFGSRFDRLDVLVNNAGLFDRRGSRTKDGYEVHFGVMHLGHFLLTNLLMEHLRAAAPSRVVTVSAFGHRFVRDLGLGDLRGEKVASSFVAYCRTKLAQVLFTRELAGRAAGTGVTAYSLHPGVINTNLANDIVPDGLSAAGLLLPGPEQGARTSVYLATEPGIERYSGRYFSYRTFLRSPGRRPAKASPLAEDAGLREKLWRASAEACAFAVWAG
jgi:NAD(P)-dependent dehydrogenase (short-subunit alcohol dehydrogenase family)